MKKTIVLLLMAVMAISANAQLEVNDDGRVAIGATNPLFSSQFAVGDGDYPNPYHNVGVRVNTTKIDGKKNIAIIGRTKGNNSLTTGSNFGIVGLADVNPYNGSNFGVCGAIDWGSSFYGGAGIFATDYGYHFDNAPNVQGLYAAYFYGNIMQHGQTMAQEIYTPADNSLSENVESVATRGGEGMLDNLLKMNVREFNMKSSLPIEEPKDLDDMTDEIRQSYEYMKKDQEKIFSRRHFGLSAQELKEIYPNLVLEAQDGYLYVNYTELVPVLIRAIQELKGELDAVKGSDGSARKAPATTSVNTTSTSGNVLYQNTPNPFKEQTTIRFSLADDAQSASICIFDMTGKMLKNLPISSGDTSISIAGWELGEGMFLYTLIVNGKEIDTKRMIITK